MLPSSELNTSLLMNDQLNFFLKIVNAYHDNETRRCFHPLFPPSIATKYEDESFFFFYVNTYTYLNKRIIFNYTFQFLSKIVFGRHYCQSQSTRPV